MATLERWPLARWTDAIDRHREPEHLGLPEMLPMGVEFCALPSRRPVLIDPLGQMTAMK